MSQTIDSRTPGRRRRFVGSGALVAAAVMVFGLFAATPSQRGGAGAEVAGAAIEATSTPDDSAGKSRRAGDFTASPGDSRLERDSLVGPDSYFVPLSPFRMYDSRNSDGLWVVGDDFVIHALTDQFGDPVLPPDATAAAFNVTVARTAGAGYVQVYGPGTAAFETSTVNWSVGGLAIANSGVSMLGTFEGSPGWMGVALGGAPNAAAHVIIDITGYYMPFTG